MHPTKIASVAGSLIVLMMTNATAQTSKGDWLIGGTVSFNFTTSSEDFDAFDTIAATSDEGPHTINTTINPGAGYFIADHFAVGLGVAWQYYSTKDFFGNTDDYLQIRSSQFAVGPFARYYCITTEHFLFYTEVSISAAFGKQETENTELTVQSPVYHTKAFSAAIAPAATILVTPKFGIEIGVGNLSFVTSSQKTEGNPAFSGTPETTIHSSNVGLNWNAFTFGAIFHL